MPDKEILISKLLEPGAMFIATELVKDTTVPPGSLGFISYTMGMDESYQNVGKSSVVIIRKGKTGKPRLWPLTITSPVFWDDNENFPKLMPEEGTKKYYIDIERSKERARSVMDMSALSFIGYAFALSRRIKYLSDQCRHKKWPESNSHPINILKKLPDYFEEDPEGHMEKYGSPDFRNNFIEEARRMSSSLVRMHLQLDLNRVDAEINASEFLLYTNKGEFIPENAEDKTNKYKFTEDNALIERSIKYYKDLRKQISDLYNNKKKNS